MSHREDFTNLVATFITTLRWHINDTIADQLQTQPPLPYDEESHERWTAVWTKGGNAITHARATTGSWGHQGSYADLEQAHTKLMYAALLLRSSRALGVGIVLDEAQKALERCTPLPLEIAYDRAAQLDVMLTSIRFVVAPSDAVVDTLHTRYGFFERDEHFLAPQYVSVGSLRAVWSAHQGDGVSARYTGALPVHDPLDDDSDGPFDRDDIERSFADPGSDSALRAETRTNPRWYSCPQCVRPMLLTRADRALGYCCNGCVRRNEQGW